MLDVLQATLNTSIEVNAYQERLAAAEKRR
jgi:hypothetical protein